MEGFRKLMAKAGSQSDKKSESSNDNQSTAGAKMKLGRFRLKMRMLSNLGRSSIVQSQQSQAITYEPTYKLQPEDNKKFSTNKAEQVNIFFLPVKWNIYQSEFFLSKKQGIFIWKIKT